jgi:hypothetical protein
VGHKADLDTVAKRKNPCPCWESNPGRPAHSLDSILTELPRLHPFVSLSRQNRVQLTLLLQFIPLMPFGHFLLVEGKGKVVPVL